MTIIEGETPTLVGDEVQLLEAGKLYISRVGPHPFRVTKTGHYLVYRSRHGWFCIQRVDPNKPLVRL